jgi:hypothetical protein
MNDYLQEPVAFWRFGYVAYILVGVFTVWRPEMLRLYAASMMFTRNRGDRLGFSPAMTQRLLTITERRADLDYDVRLFRMHGAACMLAGVVGLTTGLNLAIIGSLLAVAVVFAFALAALSAKRKTSTRAAFVAGARRWAVAWWVVVVLLVMAAFEVAAGGFVSITVAAATIVCAAVIVLLGSQAAVLTGTDITLESEVDHRFRTAQIVICASFAMVPSQLWILSVAWSSEYFTPHVFPFTNVMVVLVGTVAIWLYASTANGRSDRALRAAVRSAV